MIYSVAQENRYQYNPLGISVNNRGSFYAHLRRFELESPMTVLCAQAREDRLMKLYSNIVTSEIPSTNVARFLLNNFIS